jgi:pantothenate kinase type III
MVLLIAIGNEQIAWGLWDEWAVEEEGEVQGKTEAKAAQNNFL